MTTPSSFDEASAVRAIDERTYAWDVPDGWQQGRGAFGGLTLGAMVRAAQASEAEPARRPRVVSGELCAPVLPGPTTLTVEPLRRGSGVTYVEVRAVQAGEVVARASVMLAGDRKVDAPPVVRAAPDLPPWASLPVIAMPSPPGPVFTRHVAFRPHGPPPFAGASGGGPVTAAGYVALAVPLAAVDAPAVIGLLDAWWPSIFAAMTGPRPMGTVGYTAELLVEPATIDAATPLAYRARSEGAAGGYVVELRELWQGDRLVALNQQTFAIIA